jgi:hypothetical protein
MADLNPGIGGAESSTPSSVAVFSRHPKRGLDKGYLRMPMLGYNIIRRMSQM